jgi:hypothetical protein
MMAVNGSFWQVFRESAANLEHGGTPPRLPSLSATVKNPRNVRPKFVKNGGVSSNIPQKLAKWSPFPARDPRANIGAVPRRGTL